MSPLASPQLVSGGIAVSMALCFFIWAWNQACCFWGLLTSSGLRMWVFFFFFLLFPSRFFWGGGGGQCTVVGNIYQSKIIQCLSIQRDCVCHCAPRVHASSICPAPRAPAKFPVTHLQSSEHLPCCLSGIHKLSYSIHLFRFSWF